MTEISIREYADEDRKILDSFMLGMQTHIASIDPLSITRPGTDFDPHAYVENFLQRVLSKQGKIYLAQRGTQIVGCVVGVIREANDEDLIDLFPFRHGRVIELFVDPSARGGGIGLRLLGAMEEYFRAKQCTVSELGCFTANHGALALYKRHGYGERTCDLYRKL